MKKKLIFLFLFFASFSLLACQPSESSNDKLNVAVSIVPQATFVEEIAGDLVNIITVIPPGYSPANYEPTAMMMEDLEDADVYFAIGVPTESVTILPHLTDIYTINLEDVVRQEYSDRMFSETSRDPHIWLSIKRVIVMVEKITEVLSSLDPDNSATYTANKEHFIAELNNVDRLLHTSFANITQNKFIVFHPSYGYFAEDYGLEMIALEEDGKEPTIEHIGEVIEIAQEHQIHTVFYQAEIDSSQVEAFAEEINGQMVELNPLSSDYLANILDMANEILDSLS